MKLYHEELSRLLSAQGDSVPPLDALLASFELVVGTEMRTAMLRVSLLAFRGAASNLLGGGEGGRG